MLEPEGWVKPGFEAVRTAFAENFADQGEIGAAVAVYVGDEPVADLWGGVADSTTGRPWSEDTLQLVFSTTKGVVAICANLLAQRGELDLDAPVASYWPEFAANGKDEIPVRWLLSHRAGLPVVDRPLSFEELLDWESPVAALADTTPVWEPGTAHGYHAVTYGWLVGEVIRRVTGKTVGQFVADELAGPLGLDLYIGLPESCEGRVSRLEQPALEAPTRMPTPHELEQIAPFLDPTSISIRALTMDGVLFGEAYNDRALHRAELPAANGIATARSLARLYAATIGDVDGVRLLDDDTVKRASAPESEGPDKVLVARTRFGLGFFLATDFTPLGGEGSFGHSGAGGSLAFAQPDKGYAFAYVMNKMRLNLGGDVRTERLVAAVESSLSLS